MEKRKDKEEMVEMVIKVIEKIIERKGKEEVMDMGKGKGEIIIQIMNRLENMKGIGVDVEEGEIEKERIKEIENGVGERFEGLKREWL